MGGWTRFITKRMEQEKSNRKVIKEIAGWYPVLIFVFFLSLAGTWGYFFLRGMDFSSLVSAAKQTLFEIVFLLLARDITVLYKNPGIYEDFQAYQKHFILRLVCCLVLVVLLFIPD